MPLDTIFVVHHTHTDVGFTNDQPIFWEMQYRFMSEWQMGATIHPEATYLLFPWTAAVASGLVRIRAAQRCEMFGEPFDALPVRVRTSFPS